MRRVSPRRDLFRLLLVVAASTMVAACDTTDGLVPTAPGGPFIPTIGGTYTSSTMWRFELTSAVAPTILVCGGGLTIATQLADTFSGTFLIQDGDCARVTGSITSGLLGTDGSISFDLTLPGPDPNLLTAGFGCTYVSGDRGMRGTLIGTQLQAEARTVMECPDRGLSTLVARADGTR